MAHRGPLAIHSTKGLEGLEGTGFSQSEAGLNDICRIEPFHSTLLNFFGNDWMPDQIARGAIVGKTEVLDCFEMTTKWIGMIKEPERSFGYYAPGRFAIIFGPVEWLIDPIPARGGLGLWDWEPDL